MVFLKEGLVFWVDILVILVNFKNKENVYKLINYLLSVKVFE